MPRLLAPRIRPALVQPDAWHCEQGHVGPTFSPWPAISAHVQRRSRRIALSQPLEQRMRDLDQIARFTAHASLDDGPRHQENVYVAALAGFAVADGGLPQLCNMASYFLSKSRAAQTPEIGIRVVARLLEVLTRDELVEVLAYQYTHPGYVTVTPGAAPAWGAPLREAVMLHLATRPLTDD
jgi:hypothetical protein